MTRTFEYQFSHSFSSEHLPAKKNETNELPSRISLLVSVNYMIDYSFIVGRRICAKFNVMVKGVSERRFNVKNYPIRQMHFRQQEAMMIENCNRYPAVALVTGSSQFSIQLDEQRIKARCQL